MQLSSNSWSASNPSKKRISYERNESSKVLERQQKRVREMFPFKEPYQQQIDSMDQILTCLNERKNLLLECPTGTGKTLMLLTSAFTFIENNPEDYQILFLTKTHGQVNGLVKELNKIIGADSLTSKYAILAGRSQLCLKQEGFAQFLKGQGMKQPQTKNVNKYYESFCSDCKKSLPKGGSTSGNRRAADTIDRFIDVATPTDLSAPSRKKAFDPYEDMTIASQKCENFEIADFARESEYKFTGFSKLKFNKDPSQSEEPRLPDIEDMTTLFKSTDSQCPFYFNRYIAKQANLVFMNYNYLLNPDILKYVSKNVIDPYKKQIIIFDEAHNIEQQAESQFQTKLKLSTLEKLFDLLSQMQQVFRLAQSLEISDIILEQGLELLDKMRDQELKSQRINSKPINGKGGNDDDAADPPYEINLKVEETQEIAANNIHSAATVVPTEKSVDEKEAVTKNQATRQILSDISQRKINEPQNNKFSNNQQKKNVENSSSTTISSQPKFNCYIKIEEEEVQQEISSNVSSICDNSQDRLDTSLFLIKSEEDSEILLNQKVEEEKEIKSNCTEFIETLKYESQDLPKTQCEEILDFDKGQLSQSLVVQEQGVGVSDKFEKQKALMKSFFADYKELFGETMEYIQKLIKFSKERKQKKQRPASHLMSEYQLVLEYYKLFGLEVARSEESNKENNNVKQEEMKSILDKVNEILSQDKRTPSKLSENLFRLEQMAEFAPIFILLIRQIKIKYSKLNQVEEIEKFLGSNSFSQGNLLQIKVSLNFFANSLRPLKHKINKIQKLSNFMKEMQSFFDLSMIHQRALKKRQSYNVFENCFNIESEDLKKLQDFYLSIQPSNDFKQNLIFTIGCLSGKYAFRSIQSQLNVHSIILCSGTLAPFDILQKNLDTTFKTYSSSHVIEPKKQLFVKFIKECKSTGEILNFSFQKCKMDPTDIEEKNEQNILSTLFIIKEIVMAIADRRNQKNYEGGGVIVFFKSYELMYQFQRVFLKSNFLRQLEGVPKYFESKSNIDFQTDFSAFKKSIQVEKKTCIFFAACRGKLSEGIDLSDSLARSVIVVGMPFWHLEDPYLQSKKKYVKRVLKMDPEEWDRKQVIRCVNQAAGRSIRHIKDWGSVFLICSTFSQKKSETDFKNLISSWVLEGENLSSTSDFLPEFNKFLDTHTPALHQLSLEVKSESDNSQNQILVLSQTETDESSQPCE